MKVDRWALVAGGVLMGFALLWAQNPEFHNAPASASREKNPLAGQPEAATAGGKLFAAKCASCHGQNGRGMGNVPSLAKGAAQSANDGEVFWYVTNGDVKNGMPSWAALPANQRWQIVTYVKTLSTAPRNVPLEAPPAEITKTNAPPPPAPFTDFRFEAPGKTRKIDLQDLPAPYATKSASHGPRMVSRPANAWPRTLPGFKVEQYATGLDNPRLLRTAPNGDVFLAETDAGDIKVFRGITAEGKPEQVETFARGLNEPFGINFYPPGNNPQWVYVGNTNEVVRFAYQNGDLKARGRAEQIAGLPEHGDHSTRDIQFSADGKKMFVSVGSASNIDDPDTTPEEKNRADILEFSPDGSGMRVYAYGIRNAVGLAISPKTGELWCSVNERDGLGDNLVPDYITHVQDGGFYGWPWWYMGGNQDPRHSGKHPELKNKVITPDVRLQPHNASLELTFYEGTQFPPEYRGDIFAAEHGSWNRAVRAGYEVIRVPLHQTGRADGEYEDFVTGFVVDNDHVWGRPVGVTVAKDGSLLVSDDGSNTIWRVSYVGK
ncbi:MAG TPA: PQQ-dependent sugar dehydrogenase [Terriglobales bacterium]|nr:PQQ-dependent sugar dehydrogenase [Terriglobales bacterium]